MLKPRHHYHDNKHQETHDDELTESSHQPTEDSIRQS